MSAKESKEADFSCSASNTRGREHAGLTVKWALQVTWQPSEKLTSSIADRLSSNAQYIAAATETLCLC